MAREEYDVLVSPWRNTALQPRLWMIEAYAALPILAWLLDINWVTFYFAATTILVLTFIRYWGYDAITVYRSLELLMIRALSNDRIKSSSINR